MILNKTSKRIAQKSDDVNVLLLNRQRDRKCKASWHHIPSIVLIQKEKNKDKRSNNAMPHFDHKWPRSRVGKVLRSCLIVRWVPTPNAHLARVAEVLPTTMQVPKVPTSEAQLPPQVKAVPSD